jgi:hypothetical protein
LNARPIIHLSPNQAGTCKRANEGKLTIKLKLISWEG